MYKPKYQKKCKKQSKSYSFLPSFSPLHNYCHFLKTVWHHLKGSKLTGILQDFYKNNPSLIPADCSNGYFLFYVVKKAHIANPTLQSFFICRKTSKFIHFA